MTNPSINHHHHHHHHHHSNLDNNSNSSSRPSNQNLHRRVISHDNQSSFTTDSTSPLPLSPSSLNNMTNNNSSSSIMINIPSSSRHSPFDDDDDDDNKMLNNEDHELLLLFQISVRFSTGDTISITRNNHEFSQMHISDLKSLIRQQVMMNSDDDDDESKQQLKKMMSEKPNMRLIYQGKLLLDPLPCHFYKMVNHCFVHCILSEETSASASSSSSSQASASSVIGNVVDQHSLSLERRGFDRLRDSGLLDDDVYHVRSEFYSTRQHLLVQYDHGQLTLEDLYVLEEQWMNEDYVQQQQQQGTTLTQSADESATGDNQLFDTSNYYAFIGMFIGFYFNIAACLLLLERASSNKLKYGLIAGIICNVSFAVIRFFI